jgi:halogenation protein CepH
VDPVFSSGVHLATYAGLLAARSINTLLKGDLDEASCFSEYERRYRREYGNFYQFLTAFYDMHQEPSSYFWAAHKILGTEERGNEAFVRLVAGVSATDEPLFQSEQYFEARVGFGEWFQDMLSHEAEDAVAADHVPEFDRSKFDPERFMQGFTSEIVQVQTQALLGARRPAEAPLSHEGLVPSKDGYHWQFAAPRSMSTPAPALA